ncbi:hypothetical protein HN51_001079 [Arachis hypogaea]|nr:uncharacterized protein DS421_1g11200 [Arachis hypogaea]
MYMATNRVHEKSDHHVKEEEDEEEALSLCDLPVTLIHHKVQQDQPRPDPFLIRETREEQEDNFNFNSHGDSFSKEPEMCAADEVFFQGQILPLHPKTKPSSKIDDGNDNINQFKSTPCESRSESMDHGSLGEFRSSNSSSSRSSSLRSQNSSSSSSTTTKTKSKPKIRNQFHTIPSPKPQLRQSNSLPRNSVSSQGRKSSSAWEFFRLGVFPAPEIGLHDIKTRNNNGNRNSVSRNSSSGSSNNRSPSLNATTKSNTNNHVMKQFVGKGGGIFSGCSCSVETVARFNTRKGGAGGVGGNNNNNKNKNKNKGSNKQESETHAAKEKVLAELKNKKKMENREKKQQLKTVVMSRRRLRTFEWLKELHAISNDSSVEERALLSSSSSSSSN